MDEPEFYNVEIRFEMNVLHLDKLDEAKTITLQQRLTGGRLFSFYHANKTYYINPVPVLFVTIRPYTPF